MTTEEIRCQDCACLIINNGCSFCDECQLPISDVVSCPEGITCAEVTDLEEKARSNKIDHGTDRKQDKKDKKPKTTKVSDEKVYIFEEIIDFLQKDFDICIEKPNKSIQITLNGKKFTLDLVEHRQNKGKS